MSDILTVPCVLFICISIIKQHVKYYEQDQLQIVLDLKQQMYVNDVIGWGDTMGSSKVFKQNTIKIFDEVDFEVT